MKGVKKMITLNAGQELKLSINSVDTLLNSKSKTVRYLDPAAAKSTDVNLTSLTRDLFASSQNTYKFTKGTIDLGVFSET